MLNFLSLNAYQKVTYIFECIQLIVIFIGIIGDILVFIVFSRPNLKKHSYSFYSRVMALNDICLFIYCFKNWAVYFLDANLDIVSPFFCSIGQFIFNTLGAQSMFILLLITADRMITIVYSNRFNYLKKRWFQCLMVLIGIVVNASLNTMTVIYSQIVEINQTTNSSIKVCFLPPEIAYKDTWISFTFFIVMIVITNILNIKIVWFMLSSRRKVNRNSSNDLSHSSARDRKFAITTIGLNLSCIVLKLPLAIALLVINHIVIDIDEFIAIETTLLTIAFLDNGFSFIINFFVNSIFHHEFLVDWD